MKNAVNSIKAGSTQEVGPQAETHTCTFFSTVEASILLALNLNAFFFFFLLAKNAAASAMVKSVLIAEPTRRLRCNGDLGQHQSHPMKQG